MPHPYETLPAQAFWRSAVAEADPAALAAIHAPRVRFLPHDRIATAGSCFARHIGPALRAAGVEVLDAEPAPEGMTETTARRFGYGLFSARCGNLYTARQLVQLVDDAIAEQVRPEDVWERDGRFFDALRPGVEPEGLARPEDVLFLRRAHLRKLGGMLARTSVFVFTLGLTETWAEAATGRVFPSCPGVIAGTFDPERHVFLNLGYNEVMEDLARARALLREIVPEMRMILSVSPVPLTATASGAHVLAATAYSKAVLRAAAGDFAARHEDVDYFPAYEIVTNPAAQGRFFAPGWREVRPEGVQAAMAAFLAAQGLAPAPAPEAIAAAEAEPEDEAACEEALLDAFRR